MSITMYKRSISYNKQAGFTLLEVMIALLVLSIGMLGIASLQAASARYIYEAKIRNQAAIAINQVINRVSARSFDLPVHASQLLDPTQPMASTIVTAFATASPAATCDATAATPENDLACLDEIIKNKLPGGDYSITQMDERTIKITVQWYSRDLEQAVDTDWIIRF